ncbi:hypothetical protein [Sinorhizobium meliloti]|uniref:hypothetical protein n=1 Tax=Rhizobium meliloti TaxID=382 RepID=UPI0001E4EB3A|nr:hypothetical protein [Sinorhizobium meliloti]AEG09301.1 hypothetical protein SinmeB_5045 [Sinorhizobium meliloti BL225C]MDE4548785.1 hypothetical protein [Sinorhizobium meliloti]MDE4570583.1 hypothetical protein [Sinorhizobium meliloti]RVO55726.1 hypothetical protein CN092_15865 [Sinorhizobium meliloti]SDZ03205.1 hypothetical protein SAMN04244576_04694 [Sinorhizobium meliloti]
MSQIKQYLNQQNGLRIRFHCPQCGASVDDEVEDASFDWTNDRMSDGIATTYNTVACPECSMLYEVQVVAKPGEKDVIIDGHPNIVIIFHDDTFDGGDIEALFDDYVPDDAYEVYQHSRTEIELIDLSPASLLPVKQPLLRMMYIQHVVMLEAYLSDRLINIILDDNEKLIALVGAIPQLRDSTPKLIDIAKDPEYVKKNAKAYLHEFSFHRFGEAAKLYRAVLKVNIFADDAKAKEMDDITVKRHHLVHRNGRDNEGNVVSVNPLNVLRVRALADEMVERIETAYEEYRLELATKRSGKRPWGKW